MPTLDPATAIAPVVASTAPHPDLLSTLCAWSDKGWLRRLDSAMARFVQELDPDAAPALLVAAALLTHMEGRGDTCLALAPLLGQPNAVLGWPTAAQTELEALWQTLPTDLAGWLTALQRSTLVRQAHGDAPDRGQPLVLSGSANAPLLYLRRYWIYEEQVAAALQQRAQAYRPVNTARAQHCLGQLFASAPTAPDWQKIACALALRSGLTILTGGPGTGKTYTAARLLALLLLTHPHPEQLKIALAAPTGKAAARLRQSLDDSLVSVQALVGDALDLAALSQRIGQAKTVHALLGARPDTRQFRYNANEPLDVDVLIVDETSMVHLEMMAALLAALPAHAQLVLLGDKDQLASVEAGSVLGDLCARAHEGRYSPATLDYIQATTSITLPTSAADRNTGSALEQQTVMLQHSRRFGSAIGQLAKAVNTGAESSAYQLLAQGHDQIWLASGGQDPRSVVQVALHGRPQAPACFLDYLQVLQAGPEAGDHPGWVKAVLGAFEHFRILCAVHDGPWGDRQLNRDIQHALAQGRWLQPQGEWFVGRPVMVTRNDPALGVFNGDVGVVLPSAIGSTQLRAYFLDGAQLRSVSVGRLAHVETCFAMTIHKSQGSEFLHTLVVLPPAVDKMLTRELVYTAITRASAFLSIIEPDSGLLGKAIRQRLQRASGLPGKLAGATR